MKELKNAVETARIRKTTNTWYSKLYLPIIALCFIIGGFVATTQTAEAKAYKVTVIYNGKVYYGTMTTTEIAGGYCWFDIVATSPDGEIIWIQGKGTVPKIASEEETVQYTFNIESNGELKIQTSTSSKCDIYELESGKLVAKDISISANNGYQNVSFNETSNKPYMIQFKINDNVVCQKSFIINNNSNIIGGNN